MPQWYGLVWPLFLILEVTFCGLSNPILVGADSYSNNVGFEGSKLVRVHRDEGSISRSSSNDTNANATKAEWLQAAEKIKNLPDNKTISSLPSSLPQPNANAVPANSVHIGTMIIKEKEPDPHYVNQTKINPETEEEFEIHSTTKYSGQPKFDEKAVQRALMVCGGLAALILVYLGLKFAFIRKRKVEKRYGRIDSEMDLLDEMEDDGESEEEDDTLFDLNSSHRSQF